MILKASQRSGARQLARHLLNSRDNDHVAVHELRGFVADNLVEAFTEAYALSRGTKCTQFLFSLSLSPPETESVPIKVFETAIETVEARVGLAGQPRAIIFHEKEGRRHAHCVWSRIDVQNMTAINLPHFKLKLRDMSRELFLEHQWKMPRGLANCSERNPLNFTLAEWQKARRLKLDPRRIKEAFQDCWATSDSGAAFALALAARGYYLARGDRRNFVAVDLRGEVYAIARWSGIPTKSVNDRLGDSASFLSVAEMSAQLSQKMTDKLNTLLAEARAHYDTVARTLGEERQTLVVAQRKERSLLEGEQAQRRGHEAAQRAARFPQGLKGLWSRVSGGRRRIREQNEAEAKAALQRDRQEMHSCIVRHMSSRRQLQETIRQARSLEAAEMKRLHREIAGFLLEGGEPQPPPQPERQARRRQRSQER